MPAALVAVLAAGLAAGLTGCGSSPGEVSFTSDGNTVTTGPVRSCDVDLTDCDSDEDAVAVLDVPPGGEVRIGVPDEVAETPWQVVFRYRAPEQGAEPVDGRTTVFAPDAQHEFTLRVPERSALETVEVQQYGSPEVRDGEPSFRIRSAWVLNARA